MPQALWQKLVRKIPALQGALNPCQGWAPRAGRGLEAGRGQGPAREAPGGSESVAGSNRLKRSKDPDGGWNALFQSKPPSAGTLPFSRPHRNGPVACAFAPVAPTRLPLIPRKGGGGPDDHPTHSSLTTGCFELGSLAIPPAAVSVLLVCSFLDREVEWAPHSLPRNSFPLAFSPSLRSLFNVFPQKKCFPCLLSPCHSMGTDRGKRSQMKQVAEHRPSGGGCPNGHWVVGSHWLCTKALILCERWCGWVMPPPRTLGARFFPTGLGRGSLIGNWPRDWQGVLQEPLIGCLILSRCNLN